MVDSDGRTLELFVHPADVQDRDGAVPLLKQSRGRHPFVKLVYADSAYASSRVLMATSIGIEIVRKFADQTGQYENKRFATLKGYGLVNGRLGAELDNGIGVALWAKNMTKTRYFSSLFNLYTAVGLAGRYQAAPRTFGGTVEFKW